MDELPTTTGPRVWQPPPGHAEKVLAAALKLFDEVGYSAATIEDIRLQSDVSIGSIYHHFGNKEGIAGALYLDSLADFQRGLIGSVRGRDAEAGVRAGVAHHLGWMGRNRARTRFLMRRRETEAIPAHRSEVAALNRTLFSELADWHRPLAARQTMRDLPVPLLYAIWFGPAQEYARAVLERARSSGKVLREADQALADAAWAALRSSR